MIDDLRKALQLTVEMHRKLDATTGQGRNLKYRCIEDLVLRHGTVYRRATVPPPIHPIPKACFDQCYRLTTRPRAKWIYVEGFAASPDSLGIPINHAWVTRADDPGEAYDLAWTHPDAVYIGIPFRREFVMQMYRSSKRRMYSVLDSWWRGFPLLTGEIALADVTWPPADAIRNRKGGVVD